MLKLKPDPSGNYLHLSRITEISTSALPVIGTLRVEEDWGALPVELAHSMLMFQAEMSF
ncbi:MAG: hypothetical protein R2942_10450 [Ignavibacteria bacterium]